MPHEPAKTVVPDQGPRAAADSTAARGVVPEVHDSPRMIAQRQRIGALFGPGYGVVQRAVGFEFQTYNDSTKLQIVDGEQPEMDVEADEMEFIEAKRQKLPLEDDAGQALARPQVDADRDGAAARAWIPYFEDVEETYAKGGGIKVEKDGPDLEFVTDAFEESDSGHAALTQALRNMIVTALGIEQQTYTSTAAIAALGASLAAEDDARDSVRVKSNGPMSASAQATVGVRLSALDRLISLLGKAPERRPVSDLGALFKRESERPSQRAKELSQPRRQQPTLAATLGRELGNNHENDTQRKISHILQVAPALVKRVIQKTKGAEPLQGLVHLIVLYVLGGSTFAKYAKARTAVMSRTSLADALGALPPELQTMFFNKVVPTLMEQLAGQKIADTRPLHVNYPKGEAAAMGLTEDGNRAITIKSWLAALQAHDEEPGIDQTEAFDGFAVIANRHRDDEDAGDYQKKWFNNEYGVGMQSSTDIGARESTAAPTQIGEAAQIGEVAQSVHRLDGLVVELRNLGNDELDVSEWATFATSLFDLMLLVNAVDQDEEAALALAMQEQRSFESDLGDTPTAGVFKRAREVLRAKGL